MWRTGLIVGVTALAIIISLLVFLVLRSRSYAVVYLDQQKVWSPRYCLMATLSTHMAASLTCIF